jgi:hypothetical protein
MIAPGKFEVVERRQLLKLVEELSLGQMGLIEEKSLKEMGRVLGVDAIVTGSMTDLGKSIKVNARMISVESAKVVAVAATDIPQTGVVVDLMGKQAERGQLSSPDRKSSGTSPTSTIGKGKLRVEVNEFAFEVQSCKIVASAKRIECHVIITNLGKDREMEVNIHPNYSPSTRIIDNFGNEYTAKEVQIGKQRREGGVENTFVSGIPTKVSFDFEDVSAEANSLALLEIGCWPDEGKRFRTQIRNIPLSR